MASSTSSIVTAFPDKDRIARRCAESSCRSCSARGLKPILDLGSMPLSDGFTTGDSARDNTFPLELVFCPHCTLVQILETVPPDVLFGTDYPYYSSYSEDLLAHAKLNADTLADKLDLDSESLVVEIASNDGYLLKNFVARQIPVLGIDPSPGPAEAALNVGVPTLCDFFNSELARHLCREGRAADLIVASNVLAHVAEVHDFLEGIRILLKPGGRVVFEFPYVKHLIDRLEFDTIYHEHLAYFSLTSAASLLRGHGFSVIDFEHLSIHGGSLRIHAAMGEAHGARVEEALRRELEDGLNEYEYYLNFAGRVDKLIESLGSLLERLKNGGHRIATYGAPAKGTILLNALAPSPGIIDFAVDRNEHKHGLFIPGVRIPIYPTERLMEERPSHVLLLAWNFADEILKQQQEFREAGGKFIIPIPELRIV